MVFRYEAVSFLLIDLYVVLAIEGLKLLSCCSFTHLRLVLITVCRTQFECRKATAMQQCNAEFERCVLCFGFGRFF